MAAHIIHTHPLLGSGDITTVMFMAFSEMDNISLHPITSPLPPSLRRSPHPPAENGISERCTAEEWVLSEGGD